MSRTRWPGDHRYDAQDAGWGGSAVTTQTARNRGRRVVTHTTMPVSAPPSNRTDQSTDDERRVLTDWRTTTVKTRVTSNSSPRGCRGLWTGGFSVRPNVGSS